MTDPIPPSAYKRVVVAIGGNSLIADAAHQSVEDQSRAAAETAADFAAVIYTDAPPNGEADPLEPMDMVELEKRLATVLPGGWKLGQVHAEQPATTYAEFKREILNPFIEQHKSRGPA